MSFKGSESVFRVWLLGRCPEAGRRTGKVHLLRDQVVSRRRDRGVAADCSSRMNKRGEEGGGNEGHGRSWKERREREGGREEAASLQRLFIDKVAAEDRRRVPGHAPTPPGCFESQR